MPSDPVRIGGSHVSFRVRFATPVAPLIATPAYAHSYAGSYAPPSFAGPPATVQLSTGGGGAPRRKGRVTAVTWSGQARPGDLAATQLLDSVRLVPQPPLTEHAEDVPTRVLRRIPAVAGAPYGAHSHGLPQQGGQSPWPYGDDPEPERAGGWTPGGEEYQALEDEAWTHADDGLAHHRYPGRKVDLGLVLLPLRVFLGCISVYAGFSKLCDPVYFDGGNRGSMVRWLSSLHPWSFAQPLLDFAMAHPVGSGLAVAFTQIVVGVLSVLGLWQRAAAAAATLLSVTLLLTVSWRSVPVYDAPDIIYLAAWSPLLIAGAPFGSLDGRLALEAWRRLGPGATADAMRRRVLRRGSVLTAAVVGMTFLLGSVLGAAVRTTGVSTTVVPQHSTPPTDYGTPTWPSSSPDGGADGAVFPSAPPTRHHSGKRPKPHSSSSRTTGPSHSAVPGGPPSGTAPAGTGGHHQSGGSSHSPSPAGGTTSAPGGQAPSTSSSPQPSQSGGGVIGGLLGSDTIAGVPLLGMDGERHPASSSGLA